MKGPSLFASKICKELRNQSSVWNANQSSSTFAEHRANVKIDNLLKVRSLTLERKSDQTAGTTSLVFLSIPHQRAPRSE